MLYKNTAREKNKNNSHYLNIKFSGGTQNLNGIGAWADIYYNKGKHQIYENTPYRGYLSTIQNIAHFGLGNITNVDSVVIKWQNGKCETLKNVKADQVLNVKITNAKNNYNVEEIHR